MQQINKNHTYANFPYGTIFIVALVIFSALYIDVFAMHMPIIGLIIAPLIFIVVFAILICKKLPPKEIFMRLFLGPPVILIVISLSSSFVGWGHDQWLMSKISAWGNELSDHKRLTGSFPSSEVKFFHGYRAFFINNNEIRDSIISFDKFGAIRQTYSMEKRIFFDEVEM